ncbi:MAG: hypothetical protein WBE68_09595 [Candidatus Nitrosopolaris sp.]
MANQIQQLSPKAKENLKRNAELRDKDSRFIKIQPSEKRVLEFNPEQIEQVEAEFSGKKTQRYRYTVTDPNNDNKQEKCLEVGKRTSEDIDGYLREGHTLLKIQRFGLGKDTRYHVTPS